MAKMNWTRTSIEARDRTQPLLLRGKHKQQNKNIPPAPNCPVCDLPMARRMGPSGPFWGCHQYPRCKGSRP